MATAVMPNRNRKLLAVAILLATIAVVALFLWRAGHDQRADALKAGRAGKFSEAEPELLKIAAQHPDDIEVLDCLARGYKNAERYEEAESYLSKIIDLRPGNATYLQLRLDIHRQLKQWEKAFADVQSLLEVEPENIKIRRTAMNLALGIGRFDEAEEHCRRLLHDQPNDRDLRGRLAHILRNRGENDAAGKILDQLIQENSKDYAALLDRGMLHDETGHPDLAIPLLRRVFDDDSSRRRQAGYPLAIALDKVGQHAESERVLKEVARLRDLELFNETIKVQPENLDLQVRLAESLLRDGHSEDGVRLLKAILSKSPNCAPAHHALAKHYEMQGQAELAAKHRRLAGTKN